MFWLVSSYLYMDHSIRSGRPRGSDEETDQTAEAIDASLVARMRRGDSSAFDTIVRRHERGLRRVAASIVRDPVEAEDLVQESFVRARTNLDLLVDPSRLAAWLRRITFGVCMDWLRRFRATLFRDDDGMLLRPWDDLAHGDPSPLDAMIRDETSARVAAAIAALPERYRRPLTMYHVDGVSHEYVAAALQVPTGTARSLTTRARQRLAVLLASESPAASVALDVFDEIPATGARMHHLVNGSIVERLLRESQIPGTVSEWADVLHEGPLVTGEHGESWRAIRAAFLAGRGYAPIADVLMKLREWDDALDRAAAGDEIVIWVEHDLFDQLLLIRHLAWYADLRSPAASLSMVTIGEYPGIEPFLGLGQLTSDQLRSLLGTRQPLAQRQIEIGRRAWRAVGSADPNDVVEFLTTTPRLESLPFLERALWRFLEEFPWTDDGLTRTERTILRVLAASTDPIDVTTLFRSMHEGEDAFFIGDTSFFAILEIMAGGSSPLVEILPSPDSTGRGPGRIRESRLGVTSYGRSVLDGLAHRIMDRVALPTGSWWIGGVHQGIDGKVWQWDPARRILTTEHI